MVKARKFFAGMKTCFSVMHGLEFVGIILNGMLHSHGYPISVEILFVWMTLNAFSHDWLRIIYYNQTIIYLPSKKALVLRPSVSSIRFNRVSSPLSGPITCPDGAEPRRPKKYETAELKEILDKYNYSRTISYISSKKMRKIHRQYFELGIDKRKFHYFIPRYYNLINVMKILMLQASILS